MKVDFPISLAALLKRHMNGIRRVVSIVGSSSISAPEFANRCRDIQEEGASHVDSLPKVAESIWNTEGLSITYGKFGLPSATLLDPAIPKESLGIVHVGFGIVTAEYSRFDSRRLREIVERNCAPNYQGFAYEGIGSAMLLYEPGPFKLINRILGVVPPNPPAAPDRAGFFSKFFTDFSPEAQRNLTHGYGRLLGFSRISLRRAIEKGLCLPPERIPPFIQGLAVSFGMLNCEDMATVLEHTVQVEPAPVRASFQNGLVWVLAYCDWFAPGLLAAWRPAAKGEESLIKAAQSEAAFNVKRGYPLCGGLEEPITA
jgi:hypothetical protein